MHIITFECCHYKEKDQEDKVIKHMESFKHLLYHQRQKELISDSAIQTLKYDAEYVIVEKWE
ncbi:hypothetical protein [Virgibacillus sp. CBA3643]|uniref:FIMAH domain-containing protein n=1 Tax=Virgibacillus sp. CBA3643 TaxID=2942278 RepID=UPI0035A3BC2F